MNRDDYFKKTKSDLINICKEQNLTGYSGKTKEILIKMITTQEIDYKDYTKTDNCPTAISLFSGAGGDSLGMKNSGYNVIAYSEKDKSAIQTHNKEFPNSVHIINKKTNDSDIKNLPIEALVIYKNKIDAVFIDNWSLFNGNKNIFYNAMNTYNTGSSVEVIDDDCWKVKIIDKKFNVYLYDGGHDYEDHYKAMKQVYEHIQKNRDNELSFLYIILKRRGNNANNLVWVDKDKITLFYNYKEFTFQVSELYPLLEEYFDPKRPEYLETSFLIMYMMIVGFLWLHFLLGNKY
jgi:hypothetical protein